MNEKDNVGVLDTAIRSIISVVLLALAAEQIFSFPVNIAFVVVGLMLWVSSSTGVCYLYRLLGIDTYHLRY
ncbi:MAG: DUF2892 domain-containing protein [Aestuariibacter sp.]